MAPTSLLYDHSQYMLILPGSFKARELSINEPAPIFRINFHMITVSKDGMLAVSPLLICLCLDFQRRFALYV